MKYSFIISLLSLALLSASNIYSQTEKVGFAVIESTNSFYEAQSLAQIIADSLEVEFRNNVIFDKEEGLKDTVTCGCGEQHGYIRRGRFNHGNYVTIELNSRYSNSPSKKTYALIAMSHEVLSENIQKDLSIIKAKYPEANYFTAEIYVGCMH